MADKSSFELFQLQRECIKELQKEQPDLFVADKKFNEGEVLPEIGITSLLKDRPEGFLRLYPQDFIVEEIQQDGSLSAIEPRENIISEPEGEKFTLYFDLIKVGISSIEAINRLADKLGIRVNKIGSAGIKDAQALTSQRIALPGIRYEQVKDIKLESFFLTNFYYGRGTVEKGSLAGNRFAIFVRAEKEVNREWLKERLFDLEKNGFLNYYHTQRFGGGRLLSHKLGKIILKGEYEEAIRTFLIALGRYDIKLIKTLRATAAESYGNWRAMKKTFSLLPYTFRIELKILDYLMERPQNFIGALINIQDQTTLWVYAYASFLFNKYLSHLAENKEKMPERLPLLLSNDIKDHKIYEKYLEEDGIDFIARRLKDLKFIQLKRRSTLTKMFPKNLAGVVNSDGAALGFSLSKGAYATTFLMNLFRLQQGLPLPEWLKTTEYDTKKILKTGTVGPAKEKLKEYIFSILDHQENA